MKQGGPVVLTVFGGFGYMVLLFVGFMLLPGWMLGFCGYVGMWVCGLLCGCKSVSDRVDLEVAA